MTEDTTASAPAGATEDPRPAILPDGDYAIVEVMGFRTLVGRVSEVERFGTKLLAIEPLFSGTLLPAVLIGGGSIYQFTPCTAEVAARRQATRLSQLPSSVAAIVPVPALPAPAASGSPVDEAEPPFAPAFLDPELLPLSIDEYDNEVEC